MLLNLGSNAAMTTNKNSRSVIKVNMAVREMTESSKTGTYLVIILAYVTKGKRD